MKKSIWITAFVLFAISSVAHARVIEVSAEAQYWHTDISGSHDFRSQSNESWDWDSQAQMRLSVSLEHFIPLLPNVMVERQNLKGEVPSTLFSGTLWDATLDYNSVTAYWAPLNNETVTLHVGASYRELSGHVDELPGYEDVRFLSIDEEFMLGYGRVVVGLPFTGVSFNARGEVSAGGDHDITDLEASVRYQFMDSVLDGHLSLGYRHQEIDFNDANTLYASYEFKGPFVSLRLTF